MPTWRTTHGDMTDEEWELIADLVEPASGGGRIGRPVTNDRRQIVNAIFYVTATGCQWRALPDCYPNWNTVHRYHLAWSRDGTWARIARRLAEQARAREGRDPDASAGIIDARSVRGPPPSPVPPRATTPARRSRVARPSGSSTPSGCSSR